MEATIDQLKYPVGKFSFPAEYSNADVERWIKGIESMPAELNKVWSAFSEEKKKMRVIKCKSINWLRIGASQATRKECLFLKN